MKNEDDNQTVQTSLDLAAELKRLSPRRVRGCLLDRIAELLRLGESRLDQYLYAEYTEHEILEFAAENDQQLPSTDNEFAAIAAEMFRDNPPDDSGDGWDDSPKCSVYDDSESLDVIELTL